jgi:uncharacterized protein
MEAVLMATDAGGIPENELVYACAGTERGLDMAWIVKSCASANLFNPTKGFRFVELLAKPSSPLAPDININYLRQALKTVAILLVLGARLFFPFLMAKRTC